MCTLVILRRPGHPWPLILAGNRDEMANRPSLPPGRHWDDRPTVTAGRDELAGGSWLGVNDDGLVAVVMNREGSLGPAKDKRSRGELVLEALDNGEAREAADALQYLNPDAYRPFNLFVGDPVGSFWVRHSGEPGGEITVSEIPEGLHMLSAGEMDDDGSPRLAHYLPQFRDADAPNPETGDWSQWQALLGDRGHAEGSPPHAAMTFALPNGFGTRSGHLVAVPRFPGPDMPIAFQFAAGPPDEADFLPVVS